MSSFEIVDVFRASRSMARQTRERFEGVRGLQDIAEEEGFKIKAHAGMIAFDAINPQEALNLRLAHGDRINKEDVETSVEAVKRSNATSLSEYLDFGIQPEVFIYEEGGDDLALGIPFTSSANQRASDERGTLGDCLSAVARTRILLPDEDDYYLTIGKMSADRVDDDQADLIATEAQKLLWPSQGPGVGESVHLYCVEVYAARAAILG